MKKIKTIKLPKESYIPPEKKFFLCLHDVGRFEFVFFDNLEKLKNALIDAHYTSNSRTEEIEFKNSLRKYLLSKSIDDITQVRSEKLNEFLDSDFKIQYLDKTENLSDSNEDLAIYLRREFLFQTFEMDDEDELGKAPIKPKNYDEFFRFILNLKNYS